MMPGEFNPSRRQILTTGGLASLGLVMAACGSSSSNAGTGTTSHHTFTTNESKRPFEMATWGGLSAVGFAKAWGVPFTAATGIAVDNTPIMNYAKWEAQIESGKPGWDWGDFEGYFPLGHPSLFKPLPLKEIGVTRSQMVTLKNPADTKRLLTERAIASYLSSYIIAYNPQTHKNPPTNFAEFFDTKKFPGVRSIYNYCYGMLEVALVADGVTWDKMYPLDLDRAYAKLDTLGKNLVFWDTGAQSQQQIVAGSADYVITWNGRIPPLAQQGLPVAIEWQDNIMILASHIIPANTDREAVCAEFIHVALQPANQAACSGLLATGPTVAAGYDLIDDSIKSSIPTNPENVAKSSGMLDDDWWATNYNSTSDSWTKWVNSL
jgi:putative spermidine/putrescine transport system substrate-binding protein